MKQDFFWKTKNDGAKGAGWRRIVPALIAFAMMSGVMAASMREPWTGLPLVVCALVAFVFARMAKNIQRFVLGFVALTLMLASVVLIQSLVPAGAGIGTPVTQIRTLVQAALASLLILAPLLLTPVRRFARMLAAALYTVAMTSALFLWGYFFAARRWPSGDTFVAIAQTHTSEALEYLCVHLGISGAFALLALIAAVVFFGGMLLRIAPRPSLSKRQRVLGLLLLAIDITSFIFLCAPKIGSYYGRIGGEGYFALKNVHEFHTHHALHAATLASVPRLAKGAGGLHVLVIGESQNKMYMHAYGYGKDTTPWLDRMKTSDACIFFEHAYSNHTYTAPALQYALTEKNQYNDVTPADALSIIELAKAAGYHTVWLSNQGKNGISDTPVSIIASDADERVFLNEHQYLDANHYDGELLAALDDALASLDADGTGRADGEPSSGTSNTSGNGGTAGTLIVVHLLGCHEAYSGRYPSGAAVFDDSTRTGAYENAVRYNDDVVRQIYEHAKQAAAFRDLVYFSDHGEAVASGNGHDPDLYEPCMTYIPFYIISSETARAARPEAFAALRANAAKPFTNDLAYELLTALLGLAPRTPIDDHNNLASPGYDGDLARLRTCHGEREITPEESEK